MGTAAVIVLLVAGLPRLVARSGARRAAGRALVAAAAAVALDVDGLRDVTTMGDPTTTGDLALADLVQLVLVTVAASNALSVARWVSLDDTRPRGRPVAGGLLVVLLQLVLFGAAGPAGAAAADPALGYLVGTAGRIEVALLWSVTLAWPLVAGVALLQVSRTYAPAATGPDRVAVVGSVGGLLLLGTGAGVHVTAAVTGSPALAGPVGGLYAAGVAIVGGAMLVPSVVVIGAPLAGWIGITIALHRLDPLARALVSAAPEWAPLPDPPRIWRPSRDPTIRLYRTIIMIRDTTWDLLRLVDDDEVGAAVVYGRHCRPDDDLAATALAEACWLSYAICLSRAGGAPVADQEVVFLPRDADEPVGSVAEEVDFLTAVARAWRRRQVIDRFMAQLGPPP